MNRKAKVGRWAREDSLGAREVAVEWGEPVGGSLAAQGAPESTALQRIPLLSTLQGLDLFPTVFRQNHSNRVLIFEP